MTVYFCNKEPIDINAIKILGVSVKTNDNPIGYFGTGLKYALAVLIRTGHTINIVSDGQKYSVKKSVVNVRDNPFEVIRLNNTRLGFTTELGKNWEVWQAYRELHCNALDENGIISDKMPEGDWGTVISVKGADIQKCYRDRASIILEGEAYISSNRCEVINTEPNQHMFYRKVRAHKNNRPYMFTWNLVEKVDLTEDRTIKSTYSIESIIKSFIMTELKDKNLLKQVLLAADIYEESQFSYYAGWTPPSDEFLEVVGENRDNIHLNLSAYKLWKDTTSPDEHSIPVTITSYEEMLLVEALDILQILSVNLTLDQITIVESLGANILGRCFDGKIFIAKETINRGAQNLAATLYEEYAHLKLNFDDESRAFQDHLLERLLHMTIRIKHYEKVERYRNAG